MMEFIAKFNKFMYTEQYSPFDVMIIIVVSILCSTSMWFVALYLPTMFWSAYMKSRV